MSLHAGPSILSGGLFNLCEACVELAAAAGSNTFIYIYLYLYILCVYIRACLLLCVVAVVL